MQYQVLINWTTTAFTDESAYLIGWQTRIGVDADAHAPFDRVATPGEAVVVLDNASRRFSPAHTGSPLAGMLLPGREIILQTVYNGVTSPVFRGWITRIEPEAGLYGDRRVTLYTADAIGRLAASRLNAPLIRDRTTDQIVRAAINDAFDAPYATGWIRLDSLPAPGNRLTLNGYPYTFRSALTPAPGEVVIGSTTRETMLNLSAAIEGGSGAGIRYALNTPRQENVRSYPQATGSRLDLRAALRGSIGNNIGISISGVGIVFADTTGGADRPQGQTQIDTGTIVCDIAGDRWSTERTSALDAIREAVYTEFARFYSDTDGTIRYVRRHADFTPSAPTVTLDGSIYEASATTELNSIYSSIYVNTYPRAVSGALTVLARLDGSIRVPPYDGTAPGSREITLTFTDANGFPCGGTDLIYPPAPYTDLLVNERRDGSGVDYTAQPTFRVSPPVISGSQVTFTLYNDATGDLWVNRFQVQGRALTVDHPVAQARHSPTARSLFGHRPLGFDLLLTADANYGASLADYLIQRHSTAQYGLTRITLPTDSAVGTTIPMSPFALRLNDQIGLTDPQTGLSSAQVRILRIETQINPPMSGRGALDTNTIRLYTAPVDTLMYWMLGTSALGTTSRAAV